MKNYHPGLYRYSVFVVCWTILLLIAGALVTSNDAALAVPDWPLSYGSLFPPMVGGIFYEHSHRLIAGALGIFVLILAIWLWLKEERRWLRWFGVVAVLGVAVQALLGAEVVLKLLHYWLPVLHACFAQLVFAAVISIAVFTSPWWLAEHPILEDRGSPAIAAIALINAIVIYCQVFLGATFRHKDLPIWPHLAGACAVLVTVVWTAAVLRRRFSNSRELTLARVVLHSVFGLQILLGGAAWWSRMATANAPQPLGYMVALTVAHTVVGALLFGISVWIVLLCRRLVREPSGGRELSSAKSEVPA